MRVPVEHPFSELVIHFYPYRGHVGAGWINNPDSKVHGANMGPTWVLPAPDGPHVGPMNLAISEMLLVKLYLSMIIANEGQGNNTAPLIIIHNAAIDVSQ